MQQMQQMLKGGRRIQLKLDEKVRRGEAGLTEACLIKQSTINDQRSTINDQRLTFLTFGLNVQRSFHADSNSDTQDRILSKERRIPFFFLFFYHTNYTYVRFDSDSPKNVCLTLVLDQGASW